MLEMSTTRSGYRCTDCQTPFHADTPVNCAVSVWAAFATSLRCPECGSSNITLGLSLTDEENRAKIADGDLFTRATNWKINGETGLSSMTIFRHFMNIHQSDTSHPHDPDDLRRCLLLLEHVPEWAPRMSEMASVSPTWARIAAHWDELVTLFREETSGGKSRATRTYDLLQSLTQPHRTGPNTASAASPETI